MANWLMLDALFPPDPAALVADMQLVGARVAAAYVLRRDADGHLVSNGSWTTAHVAAVRGSGGYVLPILVPGNIPTAQDMILAIQASQARGISRGAIAVDIEQFSFPSHDWLANAIAYAHSIGWRVIRYGDVAPLSAYPVGDGDWISHGLISVRAGNVLPMPALPAGCVADQYAVSCTLNGHAYDASVIDSRVFGNGLSAVGEVRSMGGKLNSAPWLPSRLDLVVLGRDRKAYRSWNGGGAGQLDGNANYAAIDHDHTPADGWSSIDWTWDDLNRQVIYAEDMHGNGYVCVVRADGGYDQGWSRIPFDVALPLETVAVVTPEPDNDLRNALRGALQNL